MPPSPLLSARIRNTTYLSVTMRMSAQMSSEATPSTAARRSPPAVDHRVQRFAHGVERARSDVAEHDADRGEGQLQRDDLLGPCGCCVLLLPWTRRAEALLPDLFSGGYSAVTTARHSAGRAARSQGRGGLRRLCGFGVGLGGFGHGLVAHPVGEFLAAAGAVLGPRAGLVLAVGRTLRAVDADVEVIVVPEIGADLGEP